MTPLYTKYHNTDILIGSDYPRSYFGYSPTEFNLEDIIKIAKAQDCRVITKNGKRGKWYIKAKGKSREYIMEKIIIKKGKAREGVFTIVLDELLN